MRQHCFMILNIHAKTLFGFSLSLPQWFYLFKGAKNSAAPHDVTFENVFEQASGKLGQKIREKGRVSCPRLVTTERERDRHTIHTRKSTFENLLLKIYFWKSTVEFTQFTLENPL